MRVDTIWLNHPCPFAGMTRIRFKGSPRFAFAIWRNLSSLPEPPSERL